MNIGAEKYFQYRIDLFFFIFFSGDTLAAHFSFKEIEFSLSYYAMRASTSTIFDEPKQLFSIYKHG